MSEQCLNNIWTMFENIWTNVWKQTNKFLIDWEQTLREQMLDLANVWLIENKPTNVWEQTNVWIMLEQCLNDVWKMSEQMFEKTNKCLRTNIEKTNVGFRFLSADWPSNRSAWQRQNWPARRLLTIRPGGVWSLTRVAFYNFEGWGAQGERERGGRGLCVFKILTKLQTQRQTQRRKVFKL